MRCAHLFNGIGGFALAAHWMGWENIMHCEIDPFCNKVMNYHFPNSNQHEDIRTTDFTIWRGRIDLLTGGSPCQPYSTAGKRKGKEDDRHLWPEMLRAIREIQPRWIVGENVRGLISWNGGMVFDEVCADLETEGYEVFPVVLPAASVNAPHRRDRVWFIAYASMLRCGSIVPSGKALQRPEQTCGETWAGNNKERFTTDNTNTGAESVRSGRENKIHKSGSASDTTGIGEREQADENDAFAEGREAWSEPRSGNGGVVTNTHSQGLPVGIQSGQPGINGSAEPFQGSEFARTYPKTDWQEFPTQPPRS